MPLEILRKYLDEHDVRYVVLDHSRVFTAQEVAASAHVPGKELAKTVMVKIDDAMAMAVLPASFKVDFELLRETADASRVQLASEAEFSGLFPDCEIGAMPPFGNLYGMEVYVAQSLAEDEEIVFNGCSHTQLVRMTYADFERLVRPKVLRFSTRPV